MLRRLMSATLALAMLVALMPTGAIPVVAAESEAQTDGVFAFGLTEPGSIDPVNLHESEGMQVGQALFDSLTEWDPATSQVMPAAAATWDSNVDATVWTFNLVPGATFHNGDPVTAADFKYAWERICDPTSGSGVSYHLSAVVGYDEMRGGSATDLSGVVALNDTMLQVTLTQPLAEFDAVVAHPTLAPVLQSAVEADGFSEMPVGNGPFMMSEPWVHGEYIKVERFDGYHGAAPNIDGIEFDIFTSAEGAYAEFQRGNLDYVQIPGGELQSAIAAYGERAIVSPELATYYLLMNNEDAVLSDPVVRRALSLAVNRQAICDEVFGGTRAPATGIVPEGVFGFQENAFAYSRYAATEAAALLAAAGHPGGDGLPPIQLAFNEGGGHEAVLEMVQDDLAAIGVTANLAGTDWGEYLGKLSEGDYQIGRLGWIADYPIMDNFLYPLFRSDSGDNYANYSNTDVDTMLDEARGTTDDTARVALYQQIEQAIGEDATVIPLMFYRHTYVLSERVHDGVLGATGLMNFEELWLEHNETIKIGVHTSLSLDFGQMGPDSRAATMLAVKDFSGVSVGGTTYDIELVAVDDELDPDRALVVAQELVDAGVVGVIGPLTSGAAFAALPVYEDAGIPVVSGSASHLSLTVDFGNFFRTLPTHDVEAESLASWAAELGATKIALMDAGDVYSVGMADMVQDSLQGQAVTVERLACEPGDEDFSVQVAQIDAFEAELVVFTGFDYQAGLLRKQLVEAGFGALRFIGTGGIRSTDIRWSAGGAANAAGLFCTSLSLDSALMPGYGEFAERFEATTARRPGWHATNYYDALGALVTAIGDAQSLDGAQIISALHDVEYQGVMGLLGFDADGELTVDGAAVTADMLARFVFDGHEWVPYKATDIKAGMVTDTGGLGDKSFNDGAHAGLLRAEYALGVEVRAIESQDQADFGPNLDTLVTDGFDLAFTVGFLMNDITVAKAAEHGGTLFAGVDQFYENPPENLLGLLFKEQEAAYLAGVVAGLGTLDLDLDPRINPQNTIAFIGGMDIPPVERFEVGFVAGAKSVNPDVDVLIYYAGDFVDEAKGEELALEAMAEGADIIFAAAGGTGLGAIKACQEAVPGALFIGVDVDQYLTVEGSGDVMLTSAMKNVDNAVYETVSDLVQGRFEGGQNRVFGLAEGGVGLAPFHEFEDAVSQEIKDAVRDAELDIVEGRVEVPGEREGFHFDLITEGVLTVGTSPNYPPFEFVEADEIVGFDIDLAHAIAERLGLDVQYETYEFGDLLGALQAGNEIDMIASAMTITPDRAELVDFSDPYFYAGPDDEYGFAFNKENPGLRDAVNGVLGDLRDDGTYDVIYAKWLDTTPPVVTLTVAPASPDGSAGWYRTAPAITASANEPGTFFYSWVSAAGPWTLWASPATPVFAPAGESTFHYYAVDSSANPSDVASRNLKLDAVAPPKPATPYWSGVGPTSVSLAWAAVTDGLSGVASYELYDGGVLVGTTTGTSYTHGGLTSGSTHTYTVAARDVAGNLSAASSQLTVTLPSTSAEAPVASGAGVEVPVTVTTDAGPAEITVVFDQVTGPGTLIVAPLPAAPAAAPDGFRIVGGARFDVSFTGTFTGQLEIGLPYDPAIPDADALNLKVQHWINGGWVDVTHRVDTTTHLVWARVSTLSPFVLVEPENSAPVAVADSCSTPEDTVLTRAAPGVLSNDTDADGDVLTASVVTGPAHGTLVLGSDGGFVYTPASGWFGVDTFTYKANDGEADSAPATVTITVTQKLDTVLTISGPSKAPAYAGSAKLTARLKTASGAAVAGKTVFFERWTGSKWDPIGSALTDANGSAVISATGLKIKQTYRARFAESSPYRASASTSIIVKPKVKLTRSTSWKTLAVNKTYHAKGYIAPKHAKSDSNKVKIRVYKKRADGSWRYVKSFKASYSYYSSTKTRYRAAVKLTSKGSWKLVAYHASDSRNAKTYGSADYVKVR